MGRDLYELLEVNSNYRTWFKRMCDYGFTENIDYATCFPNLESENQHGGQNEGVVHTKAHTYWTQKGRLFLYEFLKGEGYLPIVERQSKEK